MAELLVNRRLAAILAADIAGYSRLMGADESATVRDLKGHQSVVLPLVAQFGGRLIDTAGDGIFAEFPSVIHAVECAVEIQRTMGERNREVPEQRRMQFRIGINIGVVLHDETRIYGDGVNVAARLESLAEVGGIYVSRVVRDQVLGKLSLAFEDLGTHQLKNIAHPVEVYRVNLGRVAPQPESPERIDQQRRLRPFHWWWAGAGAGAIAVAGTALWLLPPFWKSAPAHSLPPMSVAIMPFAAPSGDGEAARVADTLARDLVTRLGRVEGVEGRVSVISGLSFPAGEMGGVGPRELGRKLDARYLVEGDVLRGSDGNTVNLRLINTATGAQVWSERGSVPDSDVTKESSVSLYNLSNRLRQAIVSAETRRIEVLPVAALSARELVLRANVMSWDNPSLARLSEARKLIDEALRLEPDLEPAMIAGALNTGNLNDVDPHPDHDRIAHDLDHFSDRAIRLEPSDPGAWHVRTDALVYLGRWDAALQASDERIRIAPSDPNSYVLQAEVMTSMGRPDEALKLIDRVFAMNPPNRGYPLRTACQAHLLAGRADDAIATCEMLGRRDVLWYALMAAANANRGDTEKAAAAKAELLKIVPGYTISQLRAKRYSDHPDYQRLAERFWYEGLRKAGIPER